jgi:hypothetical protein
MAERAGETADPTPGAATAVPYPRLVDAEKAIRALINDDSLEEAFFVGGRAFWPEEDVDAIRIDLYWDREANEPVEL